MKRFYAFLFVCLVSLTSAFALEKEDEAAIENVIKNYVEAWNDHGGKGFGAGFAEDADFVNIFGMHFSGKSEIEWRHVKILESFLKDSKLQVLNIKFREVHPKVVIALIRWKVDGFRQPGSTIGLPGVQREGIFTQVFLYQNDQWEIVASQNTLVPIG